MDAAWINRLEPQLDAYLDEFADCFGRSDTREHLPVYVRGQLSDLPRKSVEPIALAAEVPPRTLQQFLSLLDWDHDRLRQRLHGIVSRDHADRHAVGLIDETGCPKKGTKTPGVRRQYCGADGARSTTASPRCIWVMRPTISTACWTTACTCPRSGPTTGRGAGRPAFRTRSATG